MPKKRQNVRVAITGDDIKSQVGATITHRVLTNLFRDRGVRLERTYQLNFGGNMESYNMLERGRVFITYEDAARAIHRRRRPPPHRGICRQRVAGWSQHAS